MKNNHIEKSKKQNTHDNKQVKSLPFQPWQGKEESPLKPDFLKRLGGATLISIGIVGCILTFPLLFLGALVGFFIGVITKKDTFASGLQGAKIGSLGSIYAILFGIELAKATLGYQETSKQESPPQKKHLEKSGTHLNKAPKVKQNTTVQTELTSTKETTEFYGAIFTDTAVKNSLSGSFKTTQRINFNETDEINTFIAKVNELVLIEEAKVKLKKVEGLSRVSEKHIEILITQTKNILSSPQEFWGSLEQMSNKDIQCFVSKLSFVKGKGKYSLSELDYLWCHFKQSEFEPSKKEQKKILFAEMIASLSEEQLNASFNSPDFLNLMNQDVYVDAVANTLDRKQLEIFASNSARHVTLCSMIKKLKPDVYLLGKLMAIMPYATEQVKVALIDQLAHLPHKASFKVELIRLAEYYISNGGSLQDGLGEQWNSQPT